MAKYKKYSYDQGVLLPIFFDRQILPGTFEFSLNHLIDNEVDLSIFDGRYNNDETGAPAYDPRIFLKIVLFAYSRRITSSRKIAQCCEENIIFMALSAHTRPHFTTIADVLLANAFTGMGTALIKKAIMSPGLKLPNQHAGLANSELNAFDTRTRHLKDLLPISMAVNSHRKMQWKR